MTKKELEQLSAILQDSLKAATIAHSIESITKIQIFNLGVSECIEVVEQLISGERSLDD